jgi:hypothetical protein
MVVSLVRGLLAFGLVERRFFRDWSMCPMAVAIKWGGCLRTSFEVSPGKPVTCFKSRAMQSVDREGKKRVAWAMATS